MSSTDRAEADARAVAVRRSHGWLNAILALGILNIVIAVLVGVVIWVRAGLVHFGMVDQLSHKLDSGEMVIEGVNEQNGSGGRHGDYFHDAVDLTDELLGGATGAVMLAALLGAVGHGAIGIGLFVCWWRVGSALRTFQNGAANGGA